MRTLALAIILLTNIGHAANLTLVWNSTNAAGTRFLVYEVLPTATNSLGETATNGFQLLNVSPGFKVYRVVSTNGLAGDPATTSTNLPSPAFDVRIQVSAVIEIAPTPDGPWQTATNLQSVTIAADDARRFYRTRSIIREE